MLTILSNSSTFLHLAVSHLSDFCESDSTRLAFAPYPAGDSARVTFSSLPAWPFGQAVDLLIQSRHNFIINALNFDDVPPGNSAPICGPGVDFSITTVPPDVVFSIWYDATDCGGAFYFGYNISGGEIPRSSSLLLAFGIGAALQILTAPDPVARANALNFASCLELENEVRQRRGLPVRVGPLEGYGRICSVKPLKRATPPTPPPSTSTTTTTGTGWPTIRCFVASAAYDSPMAGEVEFLRRVRDDVLRNTRMGEQFFRRFYAHYYRFSPAIADLMRADPECQELLRLGLVDPLLRYYQLAVDMPEAPLEGVPEPWRSYLTKIRSNIEEWGSQIVGTDGLGGLSGLDAVREVAVVLRYVVRTPERQRALIDDLEAGRIIPIRLEPAQFDLAVKHLSDIGRSAEEIARLVVRQESASEGERP